MVHVQAIQAAAHRVGDRLLQGAGCGPAARRSPGRDHGTAAAHGDGRAGDPVNAGGCGAQGPSQPAAGQRGVGDLVAGVQPQPGDPGGV